MKRVILDIPEDQAMGLAQLCKRFCWEDAVVLPIHMTAAASATPSSTAR
jgi:hypothetical protein